MRTYRVSYNNKSVNVKAMTPQNAIKRLYKDYYIQIESSYRNKASHMVELLDTKRNSVKYYNVTICRPVLNRKVKPLDFIEPMLLRPSQPDLQLT